MMEQVQVNVEHPISMGRRHSMTSGTISKTHWVDDVEPPISKEEPRNRLRKELASHPIQEKKMAKTTQEACVVSSSESICRQSLTGKSKSTPRRSRVPRRHSVSEIGCHPRRQDHLETEPEDDDFVGFFRWSRSYNCNDEEVKAEKDEYKENHRRYSLKHKESVLVTFSTAARDWELDLSDKVEGKDEVIDLGQLCDAVEQLWSQPDNKISERTRRRERIERRRSMEHYSQPFLSATHKQKSKTTKPGMQQNPGFRHLNRRGSM